MVFVLVCLLAACAPPHPASNSDEAFFRKYIREFPADPLFDRPNWILSTGYAEAGNINMAIENKFGDTVINCSLKKYTEAGVESYSISKRISFSRERKRHILSIENRADTMYHFTVDTSYRFTEQSRRDTGRFVFLSGKYFFLYEDFYLDSCQAEFYRLHADSLKDIKGNELPRLPGCFKPPHPR